MITETLQQKIEHENLNTAETAQLGINDVSKPFSVHTYSIVNEDSPMCTHWSEGLKMIIIKDGVALKLNSKEIEQLVNALPRTVGETY